MRKGFAIPILLLATAGIVWGWLEHAVSPSSSQAVTSATQAVPVTVAEARRADVPIILTGLGTVRAFNSVLVTSRVDGEIVKINFARDRRCARAMSWSRSIRSKSRLYWLKLGPRSSRTRRASISIEPKGWSATAPVRFSSFDAARALVAQLAASTVADHAAIEAAQVQLNYCKTRSPTTGRKAPRANSAK